jgi:fatty-acyl-CoA synthase
VVDLDLRAIRADEMILSGGENLARYEVPREVVFVDALPRNPTGNALKRELAPMAR